jgi:hypothetical protein
MMKKRMNILVSTEVDQLIQKPVFNKIKQNLVTHKQMIDLGDFSAINCLKKIISMIKDMDKLTTDTLIYTPNKELLVNVVNERNAIIFQKLKDNVATIRLICEMDRRYRAKNARQVKTSLEGKKSRRNKPRLTELVYEVECDIVSYEPPKENELHYLVTPGNGFIEINLDLSNSESTNKSDSKKLFLNTIDHIDDRVAMPRSSLSEKEKQTLFCHYSDNEIAIENITPSINSDHVLDSVVYTMMINKNKDVIELNNAYSNDDAFNDITISVSNDRMIPELFFSPEFEPIEFATEQFQGPIKH